MAFNNYGYPMYPQYYPTQPTVPQGQNSMQNGFVRVQNENEARMYPVAPGNSVLFIDENAPYCYTKTVDVSQLDRPKFEKYRLMKEENSTLSQSESSSTYALRSEVDREIKKLKEEITSLSAMLKHDGENISA